MIALLDRIVVPIDRTSASKAILSYLPALVDPGRTEVIVAEAIPFVETLLELPRQLSERLNDADLSDAQEDLSHAVARLRDRGIRARGVARIGSSIDLVDQIARKDRATLVALSQGPSRSAFGRSRDGLAGQILERTQLPLFLVNLPSSRDSSPAAPWRPAGRSILIPMAGNPTARKAVDISIELARRLGGSISLEALMGTESFDWRTLLHIQRGIELCESRGVSVERRLAPGDPTLEIVEDSRNGGAGLITLTARLLPLPPDIACGSLTRRVLQEARVPVLVLRRSKNSPSSEEFRTVPPGPGDLAPRRLPAS